MIQNFSLVHTSEILGSTIALWGSSRHGPEISSKTELEKVLPNGNVPEV